MIKIYVHSEISPKVNFVGESSELFEILTGETQGDGLSPLMFNCILETVIN